MIDLQTMFLRFRVWDKEEKCFVPKDWDFAIRIDGGVSHHDGVIDYGWQDRFIISQGTGLKDKNKTEIYTGDIIEHRKWGIGVVQFKYGEVMAKFGIGTNVSYHNLIGSLDYIKLVGNIWQNSDLIKEKQDEETN